MAAPDQPDQPDQDLFAGSKEFPEGRTSLRENQLSSIRSTRAPLATDWETALHLQAFERRLATEKRLNHNWGIVGIAGTLINILFQIYQRFLFCFSDFSETQQSYVPR